MKTKNQDRAKETLALGRRVLAIEEKGLQATRKALGGEFVRAVELVMGCSGRVVVIGIGKSGLIGRKLAATLTSTGTSAIFMHPAEAFHGDLGMVTAQDVILALSFSGESQELRDILPHLKNLKVPIIAMTGSNRSRLARAGDVVLLAPVKQEACPYNITPTASTTAMLALGDALAMALMELRGFDKEDFAKLHPGGALGRRLNLKARDIMHQGKDNPVVEEKLTVREALLIMTRTRTGAANVVDKSGKLTGFFTDGDLRRRLEVDGEKILSKLIREVMTKKPTTVQEDTSLDEILKLFKSRGFDNVPVVDGQGHSVGLVDERDLL